MIRLLCAFIMFFQSSAYATVRNFGIVDSPRYQYMKGHKKGSAANPTNTTSPYTLPVGQKINSSQKGSSNKSDRYYLKANLLTLDTLSLAEISVRADLERSCVG